MQLEVAVTSADRLKHTGKHSVEVLLDGHEPLRTEWIEDNYGYDGRIVQPKDFRAAGRRVIRLRGEPEKYKDAWLHLAVIHQRTFSADKRAAEAHVPFAEVAKGFSGWVNLEHKDQFAGRLFVIAQLAERPTTPAASAALAAPSVQVNQSDLEEQIAILASLQEAPVRNPEPGAGEEAQRRKSASGDFEAPRQYSASAGLGEAPRRHSASGGIDEVAFGWNRAPRDRHEEPLPPLPPPSEPPPQARAAEVSTSGASAVASARPRWLDWQGYLSSCGGDPEVKVHAPATEGDYQQPGDCRRRALLIGIDYRGCQAQLNGSAGDVRSIRQVLLRLDFSPEWILCLTDDQANPEFQPTRCNILCALGWLCHGLVPGDVLFFHFRGHGSQRRDPGVAVGPNGAALEDAFCPLDLSSAGYITESQVFDLLVARLPAGVRLTAVTDCCVPSVGLGLSFVCDPQRGWASVPDACCVAGDVVCLTAQTDTEVQPEALQALCAAPGGVVTTALLQAMSELAGRRAGPVTYLQLLEQLQEQLRRAGLQGWRPVLWGSQTFDCSSRMFRLSDCLPNGNSELGYPPRARHRPWRRWCGDGSLEQAVATRIAASPAKP